MHVRLLSVHHSTCKYVYMYIVAQKPGPARFGERRYYNFSPIAIKICTKDYVQFATSVQNFRVFGSADQKFRTFYIKRSRFVVRKSNVSLKTRENQFIIAKSLCHSFQYYFKQDNTTVTIV